MTITLTSSEEDGLQRLDDFLKSPDGERLLARLRGETVPPKTATPVCPICREELQLTRKDYWHIYDDGDQPVLDKDQASQPDLWTLYCKNDHELADEFECFHSDLIETVTKIVHDLNVIMSDPGYQGKSFGEGGSSA